MYKKLISKKNKALLAELVRTDFKLRYQGSVLGYTWSLLRPLLLFVILYIVFVKFLRIGSSIEHYPIYLLLGIVLWNFFSEMTNQSLSSIVTRGDLIRKIKIPRWIIVLSSSISALINLLLNLVVVGMFMVFNQVDISRSILWAPLIMLQIYLIALGASLLLSAAYVKYRDMSHIWEIVLQAMFYLTPILYPLTLITNVQFQKVLLINPMAQAIQDVRYSAVTNQTMSIEAVFGSSIYRVIPAALTVFILVAGVLYFKHEAKYFAENL